MADIPGIYRRGRIYWYKPSRKGLPRGAPAPKPMSLKTTDFEEAVETVLEMGRRGEVLLPDSDRGLAYWLRAYLDNQERQKKHRPSTRKDYAKSHALFIDAHGADFPPDSITRDHCLDWHAHLIESRKPSTAHKHVRNMRATFTWLHEDVGLCRENPFARLKLRAPRASRREKFCTLEQRDAIIREAKDESNDHYMLAVLGFHCGLRFGEILAVRADWITIHPKGGTLQIGSDDEGWDTKSGKAKMIPLDRRCLEMLEEVGIPEAGFLVKPDAPRGARYRWEPRKSWRKICERAGVPWATGWHTMRHTFGSLHAIAGTPAIKVIRWMGITQRTYDLHYAGLNPADDDINNTL